MNDMIRPADLFFTTSGSIVSQAIRRRTWGKYSHVQIVAVASTQGIDVVSADKEGVMLRRIREDEWLHSAILTLPGMTIKERNDVVKFCFSKIGAGYDFLGLVDFLLNKDLQVEDRYFCSELVFLAYKTAGIMLQERVDHAFISPRDLYISPLLRVMEERE